MLYTLFLSFTKYDGFKDPVLIGFKNYKSLMVNKYFWNSFINTWKIWLPNIILQLVIALFMANWLTNARLKIKKVGFFRAVFYFPNIVTAASIAVLFIVILDWQHGALNQILFGQEADKYIYWMVNPARTQFIISLIQTWMWFGVSMIILMAGIQGIPSTYYEAAVIDGATEGQIFFKITLPLLMPVLTYVVITSLIGGMQIFDIPFVISIGPGVVGEVEKALSTMVVYLYNTGFRYNRMGYASSISYVLFIITVCFSVIYLRITKTSFGSVE
jgi:multiple sugar transport system permease protein